MKEKVFCSDCIHYSHLNDHCTNSEFVSICTTPLKAYMVYGNINTLNFKNDCIGYNPSILKKIDVFASNFFK